MRVVAVRAAATVLFGVLVLAACGQDQNGEGQTQAGAERWVAEQETARCLTERGWEVSVDSLSGGVQVSAPPEQMEQFIQDSEECGEKARQSYPEMDRAAAEDLYDTAIADGECLRQLGYPVPEPPSRAASVESLLTDGDPLWDPYALVADDDNYTWEDWERALTECPQTPLEEHLKASGSGLGE